MTCETCSCEIVGPGAIKIHDYKKWLAAPVPCPDCMERARAAFYSLGKNAAEKIERQFLEAILSSDK